MELLALMKRFTEKEKLFCLRRGSAEWRKLLLLYKQIG